MPMQPMIVVYTQIRPRVAGFAGFLAAETVIGSADLNSR